MIVKKNVNIICMPGMKIITCRGLDRAPSSHSYGKLQQSRVMYRNVIICIIYYVLYYIGIVFVLATHED